MTVDEAYWLRQRERVCLEPGTVYLNSGSYSPLPRSVFEAVSALRSRLARSPSDFYWRAQPAALNLARQALAEYLGTTPAELLLMPNATFAVNLIAASLELPAGTEILLTDLEYGAMRFVWERLAGQRGLQVRQVRLPELAEDPAEIVQAVRSALTDQTRVLFFSHVTSPTGLVLPAEALCRLAAERKIVSVVDGAHAPGMIPLDVTKVNADYYVGNCHKWLMAPTGAAFLAVRGERRQTLQPLLTSWGWEYDPGLADADSGWGGSYWARNLEFHGTRDSCAMMVLPEVLRFRHSLGESAIAQRVRRLVEHLRKSFEPLGYRSVTPRSAELSGSMTAFAVPQVNAIKARDWIWQSHRIEAPFLELHDRCLLRVSTAWFNTEEEIDRLAGVMRTFPCDRLR